MTVSWGSNSKASGYNIQYSTASDFSKNCKTVTVKGKNSTEKKMKGLPQGKTYYVRVRSYKSVSGKKYYSAWSAQKKVKIK